ncbi:MAG: hypothetical protein JNL90_18295 [Planctomycetes bacterium]|nr:hypothetical protein [Planctomycetota bacterium]
MTRQGDGRHSWRRGLACALALGSSGLAFGGEYSASDADAAFSMLRHEVPGLRANWDFESGFPTFIFGKPIRLFGVPQSDADYEAAARRFVDAFPGLFGGDSSTLVTDEVRHLALSRIGTTDKTAVVFTQWVDGIAVKGGSLCVLFNSDGAIIGIENNSVANAGEIDVTPTIGEDVAQMRAMNEFARPARVVGIEFMIVRAGLGNGGRLAWLVELDGGFDAGRGLPVHEKIFVDAKDGSILARENMIHTFTDLKGETRQWATPGTKPDTASNPVQRFLLGRGDVNSAVGNTDTDMAGLWTITYGGSSVQTITWAFGSTSTYAQVDDQGGADFTKSASATPGVMHYTGLNQSETEYNTAEMNAQRHAVIFREWVKTLDPTDTKMDFKQKLNVNQNSSCNAYYNGSSTNYYRKGGGCNNTCYSTVVAHETGHWANDKYGSNNGADGFGEGTADVWAMYIYDDPIVGDDFFTGGGDIRNGNNTRPYCGSCGAGCYGEVHADGEVLMGAFWKVRVELNNSLGDAAGDLIADTLFHAWYVAYNAKTICDTNETQILTLDDNNGNIDDGTPNSVDIEQGFEAQGYPGYY